MTVFYWLVLFILLVVVELCTLQLVSFWFAVGSLAGLFVSLLHGSTELQLVAFLIVSFILLILVKPITDRKLQIHHTKTNVESLVGRPAKVIRQINGSEEAGIAVVNGLEWTAVASDGSVFEEGTYVTIKEISGVKLVVEAKAE